APRDSRVNRALARLYEQRGNFAQAIALWELVRAANPRDLEAASKAKDLAASDTIARGHYEAAVGGLSGKQVKGPARQGAAARPPAGPFQKQPAPAEPEPEKVFAPDDASPAERRAARDAVALEAKIDADPTNPVPYLQLAAMYRRAGLLDRARSAL